MGTLSFLFEGTQPPNATTSGTTVEGVPQYVSDYMQNLLAGQTAVASQPYQAYTGPRIAGLNADQLAGFEQARNTVANTPGALTLAQPYLNQAGKTFTGSTVQDYMSPYTQNVTDRAAQLTNRALEEKLLPQLEGVFGAAGHDVRSSAYKRAADRGVRDLAEGLQAQNLAALEQGYQTAGNLFNQDASRSAELGLGMGPLAQYAQQQGLTGANALAGIGATQQAQTQQSLDLAYQDFLRQQGYPQEQIDKMRGTLTGLQPGSTTTSTEVAPSTSSGPSPLAQLGSLASLIKGGVDLFRDLKGPVTQARGGRIRYNRGGPLRVLAYA